MLGHVIQVYNEDSTLWLTKIKFLEKVGLESIFGDYKNSKYSWNEC